MNLEHQIAQQLARCFQIKLGILFGLVVRRQARIGSDHDFAIAADRTLGIYEKMALIKGLAQLAPRPLDLVNVQTAGGLVFRTSLRNVFRFVKGIAVRMPNWSIKMFFNEAGFKSDRNCIVVTRRSEWTSA